ncbi:MAG: NAD-dependent epimerase/dehydratase family protein [Acidobacteriaceae bacterium]|nr:NAD-dependent epimerase/dehydratase family protein [Acidobacteriaceae bacterium]
MKILLIGATGFIGPFVVRELVRQGHETAVFHRGNAKPDLPDRVQQIFGDRQQLGDHGEEFRRFAPEVIVDCILSSGRQARAAMQTFRGLAQRVVALSSGDVYRACGILNGTETGALQPVPLTEDSELRRSGNVYPPETLHMLRGVFPWLDEEYDKIPVERAVMGDPELPGTVLRLPMVYGPGDPLHRLFPYIKRMDEDRPAILLQEDAARWRGPRGFVENVAAAVAVAAVSELAAGRIFNVTEQPAVSEKEWVERIGEVVGWPGKVLPIPKDATPAHIRVPYNCEQDWAMSSDRIRAELGYAEPVDQRAALERTIAWERAHPPQFAPQQFDYAAEDEAIEIQSRRR